VLLNNKRKTTGGREKKEFHETYERKTIEMIELPDL